MSAILKIIGTGSTGNNYILKTDTGETLILELGCRWKDILKSLDYDISKISGVLCSHIHGDHSASVPDALLYRIPVFSCQEVADKYPGVAVLENGKRYGIGDFIVQPLSVPHNAENYAYIISHESFGKLLFATDLTRFPYNVKGLNTIMIEVNWSQDIVIDHLCENVMSRSSPENHMEINETLATLERLESPELMNVILIHLSDVNSNEREFREKVQEILPGVNVYVADKGMEIELNKEEF